MRISHSAHSAQRCRTRGDSSYTAARVEPQLTCNAFGRRGPSQQHHDGAAVRSQGCGARAASVGRLRELFRSFLHLLRFGSTRRASPVRLSHHRPHRQTARKRDRMEIDSRHRDFGGEASALQCTPERRHSWKVLILHPHSRILRLRGVSPALEPSRLQSSEHCCRPRARCLIDATLLTLLRMKSTP